MNYLKQFLSGANILVVLPHYISVKYSKHKNYEFFQYSILAPLWYGLWNVMSYIVAKKLKIGIFYRFILVSAISSFAIMCISTYFRTYNFTKKQWMKYYIGIFIKYQLIWNLLVKNIEKNI